MPQRGSTTGPTATTSQRHLWSTHVPFADEKSVQDVAFVMQVESKEITITVNRLGATVAVAEALGSAVVTPPPLVASRPAQASTKRQRVPRDDDGESDESECQPPPLKRQSVGQGLYRGQRQRMLDSLSEPEGKLLVDTTGLFELSGNTLYDETLESYRTKLVGSDKPQTDRIRWVNRLLSCFTFLEPLDDAWVTLDVNDAQTMLHQALRNKAASSNTARAPTSARSKGGSNGAANASLGRSRQKHDPRPLVYCHRGSHKCNSPGNVEYRNAIQTLKKQYQRSNADQRTAMVDDIVVRFNFQLSVNAEWETPSDEFKRNKVKNAFVKKTPSQGRSKHGTVPPDTLTQDAVGASRHDLDAVAVRTGQPVVYCGIKGHSSKQKAYPGNVAFHQHVQSLQTKYFGSDLSERKDMVQSIVERFNFQRPANAQLTEWAGASEEWARVKVKQTFTKLHARQPALPEPELGSSANAIVLE